MNTRDTAVRVRGVRGVPKYNTVPVPALPVLETLRVFPYPCGTLVPAVPVLEAPRVNPLAAFGAVNAIICIILSQY